MTLYRTDTLFGVIGGLGPAATARLHTVIVQEAARAGAVEDTDYPALLISSAPAVGLDAAGAAGPGFVASTQRTIDQLAAAGVGVLVSACNTLDVYYDQLRVPVRYLSAVMCAAAEVSAEAVTVGVLTSAASRAAQLYDTALDARQVLYATDQSAVELVIAAGMSGQPTGPLLAPLVAELVCRGAQEVVLGCTELEAAGSGLASQHPAVPVIDSVVALARRIVKESQ